MQDSFRMRGINGMSLRRLLASMKYTEAGEINVYSYFREEPFVIFFARCFYSGLGILMRWLVTKTKTWNENSSKPGCKPKYWSILLQWIRIINTTLARFKFQKNQLEVQYTLTVWMWIWTKYFIGSSLDYRFGLRNFVYYLFKLLSNCYCWMNRFSSQRRNLPYKITHRIKEDIEFWLFAAN